MILCCSTQDRHRGSLPASVAVCLFFGFVFDTVTSWALGYLHLKNELLHSAKEKQNRDSGEEGCFCISARQSGGQDSHNLKSCTPSIPPSCASNTLFPARGGCREAGGEVQPKPTPSSTSRVLLSRAVPWPTLCKWQRGIPWPPGSSVFWDLHPFS